MPLQLRISACSATFLLTSTIFNFGYATITAKNADPTGDVPLTYVAGALSKCLFHFPRPEVMPILVAENPYILKSEAEMLNKFPDYEERTSHHLKLVSVKYLRCFAVAAKLQNVADGAEFTDAFTKGLNQFNGGSFAESMNFYPKVFLFFGGNEDQRILNQVSSESRLPSNDTKLSSVLQLQWTYVILGNAKLNSAIQTYSLHFGSILDQRSMDFIRDIEVRNASNQCNKTVCHLNYRTTDGIQDGKSTLWNTYAEAVWVPWYSEEFADIIQTDSPDPHKYHLLIKIANFGHAKNTIVILPKTNGTRPFHPHSPFRLTMVPFSDAGDEFDDIYTFVTSAQVYNVYEAENFWTMLVDPHDGAIWLLLFLSIVGVAGVVAAGRAGFWGRSLGFCAVSLAALLDQWLFKGVWKGRSLVVKAALALPCSAFVCMLLLVNNGYKSMIRATYILAEEHFITTLTNYREFEDFKLVFVIPVPHDPDPCNRSINIPKLFESTNGCHVTMPYTEEMPLADYVSLYMLGTPENCPVCDHVKDGFSKHFCQVCKNQNVNESNTANVEAFETMTVTFGAEKLRRLLQKVYNETSIRACPYCAEIAQENVAFLMLRAHLPYYWPMFLEHMAREKKFKFAYTGRMEINDRINVYAELEAQRAPGAQYVLRRLQLLRSSGILAQSQKLYLLQYPPEKVQKFVEEDEQRPDPKAIRLDSKAVMAAFGILFIGFAVAYGMYGIEKLMQKWFDFEKF